MENIVVCTVYAYRKETSFINPHSFAMRNSRARDVVGSAARGWINNQSNQNQSKRDDDDGDDAIDTDRGGVEETNRIVVGIVVVVVAK